MSLSLVESTVAIIKLKTHIFLLSLLHIIICHIYALHYRDFMTYVF